MNCTEPAAPQTLRVATLGPAGTNHDLVVRRYMQAKGVRDFEIRFVSDFRDAVAWLEQGEVHCIVQCAVHPDTSDTLGQNYRRIFAVDCFISDSQELAVLTRTDVSRPASIGVLLPSNEKYTDLTRWERVLPYRSLPLIKEALLAGEVDSGLVYRRFADEHPELLRVDELLGSPDDVWIVYGRHRAFAGELMGYGSYAGLPTEIGDFERLVDG